jgi:hypothetical protein
VTLDTCDCTLTHHHAIAVFEEGGFPTSEFTNIYGLMTVHGIPKPGWRGFQLLNEAGDTRVPVRVTETHGTQYETPTNDRVQQSTIAQAGEWTPSEASAYSVVDPYNV